MEVCFFRSKSKSNSVQVQKFMLRVVNNLNTSLVRYEKSQLQQHKYP